MADLIQRGSEVQTLLNYVDESNAINALSGVSGAVAIPANKYTKISGSSGITLSFTASTSGKQDMWLIEFSDVEDITWPASLLWEGGSAPSIGDGNIYQVGVTGDADSGYKGVFASFTA